MIRDQRAGDNWAFLYAQEKALEMHVPLVVVVALREDMAQHSLLERSGRFMFEGLSETFDTLVRKNVRSILLIGNPVAGVVKCAWRLGAGLVVTDYSPLEPYATWKKQVARELEVSLQEVDAHNVVPVWEAYPKQAYSARILRPKIQTLLPRYLVPFPKMIRHPYTYEGDVANLDLKRQFKTLRWLHKPATPLLVKPGAKAGLLRLKQFIERQLPGYSWGRNDPNCQVLSGLSPYFHFGQVAPARAALAVLESQTDEETKHIFLEELLVRRELADNFCHYNADHTLATGFPLWAQKTLAKHAADARPFMYTKRQFEAAETHDDLWNAAQKEMVVSGKMHGYMRMYWAKKILEWSPSATEALSIANSLNDVYELDGRDPNGYTGVAWSIGGVHDRPWFERPIYGLVRTMTEAGIRRKFDASAYIDRTVTDLERLN